MTHHKVKMGFTIIELLISMALSVAVVAAAIKTASVISVTKSELATESNQDVSQLMQKTIYSDLVFSASSEISVGETNSFNLYVCKFVGSGIGQCRRQDDATTNNTNGMYCIAASTTARLKTNGQNSDVIQLSMYRGVSNGANNGQLEYFYGSVGLDRAGLIQELLKTACTTGFQSAVGTITDGQWVRVNNPDVVKLRNFLVCGVDNSSPENFKVNAPPKSCLPVSNQMSTIASNANGSNSSVNCIPGQNGVNAIWLHYSLVNPQNQNATPYYSTQLLPFWNRPCVNRNFTTPTP